MQLSEIVIILNFSSLINQPILESHINEIEWSVTVLDIKQKLP